MSKKIISILLVIVMLYSQLAIVAADTGNNYLNPTPEFIEFIDEYFENPAQFVVFNKNGEDVGDRFYEANIDVYQEAEYGRIMTNISQNVSRFSKHLSTVVSNQNVETYSSSVTKTVLKEFSDTIVADNYPNSININYMISGRITYNANTGVISSCSAASFDLRNFEDDYLSIVPKDISTNSTIASNKFSATFSSNFHIIATVQFANANFLVGQKIDFGWISNSVTGYVE